MDECCMSKEGETENDCCGQRLLLYMSIQTGYVITPLELELYCHVN